MGHLLSKNDKLLLAKLKEIHSRLNRKGMRMVTINDLTDESDLSNKMTFEPIEKSLMRLINLRMITVRHKIITGNEPQRIGLKIHHKHDKHDPLKMGEIIAELPNDKVRVRWDSGSVACYKFKNLVVVEEAPPKSRLEQLERELEKLKKEAHSQALRRLNELTPDYSEKQQIGYQRTFKHFHNQELKKRQSQIRHLESKIAQLQRQIESHSMKKWKTGDEFVEGNRRGILIKPIESRQTQRAWLAKINGCYNCIVSLDFIEPPPMEENGQLLLFRELASSPIIDEPPDPDDFPTIEEYNWAFERWNSNNSKIS